MGSHHVPTVADYVDIAMAAAADNIVAHYCGTLMWHMPNRSMAKSSICMVQWRADSLCVDMFWKLCKAVAEHAAHVCTTS